VDDAQPDLICVSHLWWDSVWQRPHQLLSRLARHYRVLWIEEPHIEVGPPGDGFVVVEERPNLSVARLVYRGDRATFRRWFDEKLARIGGAGLVMPGDLRETSLLFGSPVQARLERDVLASLASRSRRPRVLWLYTPTALSFVDLVEPDLVVYDVMDDLAAFKLAPPGILEQRAELLSRADLVFAGGPSLHEATRSDRPDAHLFPSGVEQDHFARALEAGLPIPAEVRALPRPIVGFFGVIDERIDLHLLERAAVARPDWSWVLIGPVVKIDEALLPRLPNIHYLGQQDYRTLPAYLKAFDVAMMPFALNEATRSISPTKTLEYMAAHRPIVSTGVRDVVSLYGEVVWIADGPEAFVATVQSALDEGALKRERRLERERDLLRRSSWDRIVDGMDALVRARLGRTLAERG